MQSSLRSTPKACSLTQQLRQYRLCQGTNEQGILVRTDTVLVSSFFLEVWTRKTGLTIRFLITQAQKIGVLQVVDSDKDACDKNGEPFNPLSPIP